MMVTCGAVWRMEFLIFILGLSCAIEGLHPPSVTNVALGKDAVQSTNDTQNDHPLVASKATDGNIDTHLFKYSCSRTAEQTDPYWYVDLMDVFMIVRVKVYGRSQCCDGINGSTIDIGNSPPGLKQVWQSAELCGTVGKVPLGKSYTVYCNRTIPGRYVRVFLRHRAPTKMTLCEVLVYGYPMGATAITHEMMTTTFGAFSGSTGGATAVARKGSTGLMTLIGAIGGCLALVLIAAIVIVIVCLKKRKKSPAFENVCDDTIGLQAQANALSDAEDGYSSAENLDLAFKGPQTPDAEQNGRVKSNQWWNMLLSEPDKSKIESANTDNIAALYAMPDKNREGNVYAEADEPSVDWFKQSKLDHNTPSIQLADSPYEDVNASSTKVETRDSYYTPAQDLTAVHAMPHKRPSMQLADTPNKDVNGSSTKAETRDSNIPANDVTAVYAMPDKTKKTKKYKEAGGDGSKANGSKGTNTATSNESRYENLPVTNLPLNADETAYYNTSPVRLNFSTEDAVQDMPIYVNTRDNLS